MHKVAGAVFAVQWPWAVEIIDYYDFDRRVYKVRLNHPRPFCYDMTGSLEIPQERMDSFIEGTEIDGKIALEKWVQANINLALFIFWRGPMYWDSDESPWEAA